MASLEDNELEYDFTGVRRGSVSGHHVDVGVSNLYR